MSQSRNNVIKGLRRTVLAALGLTVLGVTSAWATPIVTTWTYNVTSQFNTGATQFTSGNCGTTNTATQLAWGCTNHTNQSSLVVNGSPQTGQTVDTFQGSGIPPAPFVSDPGVTLTHNNFVISGGSKSLKTAELDTVVTFTAPGAAGSPFDLNFGIKFDETSNSGNCAVAPISPNNPCPDIFVLSAAAINVPFTFDGNNYFLNLFPATNGIISALPDAACSAAGAAAGCLGFVTQEKLSNELHFGLTVTTAPIGVPEPGTLGMLGLGLLGLGGLVFLRRRRPSVH